MREILTSTTYRRLSAVILTAGMPFGLSIPGQLMFLIGWLAQPKSLNQLPTQVIKSIRDLTSQLKAGRLESLFNLLSLWMLFTSFFALDIGTALTSSFMAILIAWACFVIIVPYLIQDKTMHTPLVAVFVTSATLASALCIARYYRFFGNAMQRAQLSFFGSNALGNVLAVSLLTSVLLMANSKPRWRPITTVSILMQLTALVLTYSRGAWLALMAGIVVLVLCTRSKAMIALAVAVLMVFSVFAATNPVLLRRLQSIVSLESNLDRVEHFEVGVRMIQDRPLTGFGVGNIRFAQEAYREPPSPNPIPFLHNVFIEYGATTGVPGLLILVTLIVGLLFIGIKSTIAMKAPLDVCVAFALIVAQVVHLQVDLILSGAAAMPLGFIPIGVLLRYYGSLTSGSQALESSENAVDR